MTAPRRSPGPAARRAFRTGIWVAAIGALAALGWLYWLGMLTPLLVGFALVVLFPVYLLVVASILSVWLGYDKDMSNLRRVSGEQDTESDRERGLR